MAETFAVNDGAATERENLERIRVEVRELVRTRPGLRAEMAAAYSGFLELEEEYGRLVTANKIRELELARELVSRGLVTDPEANERPLIVVEIPGTCPIDAAKAFRTFPRDSLPQDRLILGLPACEAPTQVVLARKPAKAKGNGKGRDRGKRSAKATPTQRAPRKPRRSFSSVERRVATAAIGVIERNLEMARRTGEELVAAKSKAEAEDRRKVAKGTHEPFSWNLILVAPDDWKVPIDPNSLKLWDLSDWPEADRRTIVLYRLSGLLDALSLEPIVPEPPETGDPVEESRRFVRWRSRQPVEDDGGDEVLAPRLLPVPLAAEMLEVLRQWIADEKVGVDPTHTIADGCNSERNPSEWSEGAGPEAIDEHDAAVLTFLSKTPTLRRKIADVLPDHGPQDRKAVARRLRKLADRTPPLVDYPEGGRSGVAILPAGVEALKRAAAPTPH